MIYVAFTLGLFGSLHCLGMCGPLAFALLPGLEEQSGRSVLRAIGYNMGRVISYISLGLVMGLVSGFVNLSGLQRPVTIALGVLFIILFVFSLDLEKLLFKSSAYKQIFTKYRSFLTLTLSKIRSKSSLLMGVLNGLIPCGLVYLALAGAITSGGFIESGKFMLFFGLGTFPAMFVLLVGISVFDLKRRLSRYKVFSLLQLFVGFFLLYRAFAVELPPNLDLLWSMGKVMCH